MKKIFILDSLLLLLLNIAIGQSDNSLITIATSCKCSPGETTIEQIETLEQTRTYKVTNTGTCGLCTTTKSYKWTISSNPSIAKIIDGENATDKVKVQINGSGLFTLMVDVTITCSSETPPCKTGTHLYVNTTPKSCNLIIAKSVEPKMTGGLRSEFANATKTIMRDEYIALGAEGMDFDELKLICQPSADCNETVSKKSILLTGKVKFKWEIVSGEGAFVKLGCLPEGQKLDSGDNVIFQPPYVPLPTGKPSTETTQIKLTIVDDNPTQPTDDPIERTITIITKREIKQPDKYTVEIKSVYEKVAPPGVPTQSKPGTCKANDLAWEKKTDLIPPSISLPDVADNDKIVVGQWIVLTAKDQDDSDTKKFSCLSTASGTSGTCTNSAQLEMSYEDNVVWTWKIENGGGSFVAGNNGRFIIYEAPKEITKGDQIAVTITVSVKNLGDAGRADAEPEKGKIVLNVYRAGVKLALPEKDYLPVPGNSLSLQSKLMYKDGTWKPGLAHMSRIHFFELLSVSREKGECMNYPTVMKNNKNQAEDCRDYYIKNENEHEAFNDEKAGDYCKLNELFQQARSKKPKGEYAITIHSRDYGGYGYLVSFASVYSYPSQEALKNKQPINPQPPDAKPSKPEYKERSYESIPLSENDVSRPQGRKKKRVYNDNRVNLPLDVDENFIADNGWQVGVVPISDPDENYKDEDNEPVRNEDNAPVGDGFPGDGLTNYEEYRGFKVIDAEGPTLYTRTNINRKDVFIQNEDNLPIELYTEVTGFNVHQISKDQYINDQIRKINFNANHKLHQNDQLGLLLRDLGANQIGLLGKMQAIMGDEIAPPNWVKEVRIYITNIDRVCRSHNLNVNDKRRQVVAHELCHASNVYHHGELGNNIDNRYNLVHGVRSGDLSCIMRYDNAGNEREAIGSTLCNTRDGTGNPFGDARNNRGNCIHQLRISGKDANYPKRN